MTQISREIIEQAKEYLRRTQEIQNQSRPIDQESLGIAQKGIDDQLKLAYSRVLGAVDAKVINIPLLNKNDAKDAKKREKFINDGIAAVNNIQNAQNLGALELEHVQSVQASEGQLKTAKDNFKRTFTEVQKTQAMHTKTVQEATKDFRDKKAEGQKAKINMQGI